MEEYIQTIMGIIVSIILFWIGYRQTIGAKKERIKAANDKLIDTILRRVVLEDYHPKIDDINRIIEGKSRDFKVREKDLLSSVQILNTIYTRIFENDLIPQELRDKNIEKLGGLFSEEKKIDKTQDIDLILNKSKSRDKDIKYFNLFAILLGLTSSIIGVLVASSKSIFEQQLSFDNNSLLFSIFGSLIAVTTVYVFIRFKDRQESSDSKNISPIIEFVNFEKEVMELLKKLNASIQLPPDNKDAGFDLGILKDNKKIAIEIKAWRMRPPISIINHTIQRLQNAMNKSGYSKGIIITKEKINIPDKLVTNENIKIITLNELKRYLLE